MAKKIEGVSEITEKITKIAEEVVSSTHAALEHFKNLSGKSLKELLVIKDAVTSLITYYDNYAKANTGNYPFDTKEIHDNARNLSLKYGRALVHVINAIKDKTDEELYA